MPTPNALSPDTLHTLIGHPDCPVLVDVCIDEDFRSDPYLVPGSFRHPHTKLFELKDKIGSRDTIVICQKGRKLSQGVAAWLRSEGIAAMYLAGGMADYATLPNAIRLSAKAVPATLPSIWVSPENSGAIGHANAWFIRRFVDRNARFLFVAQDEIPAVADRFSARALNQSTIHYLINSFELRANRLSKLANLIEQPANDPLTTAFKGAFTLFQTDLERLEAFLKLFDAIYAGLSTTDQWPLSGKAAA